MSDICEFCGRILVLPCGPPKSPILLLAEFPGYWELRTKQPWSGPAGDILKKELRRVGVMFEKCRATNLWSHEKDLKTCEFNGHWQRTLQELSGRKAVLLMGSDVSTWFLGLPVSEVTSLVVQSDKLPRGTVAVAMYNPAIAQHDKLGETRLAIEKFGEIVRDIQLRS